MTENAKIILLNSEHYDAQKVIDKMQGEEGFETLKISKEALSELVDKSRAEMKNSDTNLNFNPIDQGKVDQDRYATKFVPLRYTSDAEIQLRKKKIDDHQTRAYILRRTSTKHLPKYERWLESDATDFLVHPDKNENNLDELKEFKGLSWPDFVSPIVDHIELTNAFLALFSVVALFWGLLIFPGSLPIVTVLYLILIFPKTRNWIFGKMFLSQTECDKWMQEINSIDNSLNLFREGQQIQVSDFEHIKHLSLGQFFQPKNYLFRFMGYATNLEHVFLLRKQMRGTSDDVEDYITRFTPPQLVTLHIDEFVKLYCGESLEKSDQWWDSRIITPDATHG